MTWVTTDDVDEFLAAAGPFLRVRAAENTVLLSVAETVRARGRRAYGDADPLFGWWHGDGGDVGSAFLQTPPHPVLLAVAPARPAAELAAILATGGRSLPGVNAVEDAANAFAAEWARRTADTSEVSRRTRLYRLGDLVEPAAAAVPGRARLAGPGDRDLLLAWYEAFGRDVGEDLANLGDVVDDVVGHGGMAIWEVDGASVSMAGRTQLIAGAIRVAPVYTPGALRGRGYGGAATAAVSRGALDLGAEAVVLYTDLANPTSNSLYQRLGYRPVHDRVVLRFAPRSIA